MSVSDRTPVHADSAAPQRGYYGVPVIHGSHWKWFIIWYFYFGGISGAAAVIAAFARLFGGPSAASFSRIATYVSFVAFLPCPPLLILDLGRPRRFLNMVRTIRFSSPMSLGSWGLATFGLISTENVLQQILQDLEAHSGWRQVALPPLAQRVLTGVSALVGFFVAGYTGTLLAATAVPLWSKRPALLGPLFLSSAMTSGAAAIALAASISETKDNPAESRLQRLEAIFAITECTLLAAWLIGLGPTGAAMTEGRLGSVVRHGVVGAGIVLPLATTAASRRLPRQGRRVAIIVASALTLGGVFALRYAVVEGGRRSADDPQATFDMTG